MSIAGDFDGFKERREQWRRLVHYWHNSLVEANGKSNNSAFDVKSLDDVKHRLEGLWTHDTVSSPVREVDVGKALAPALDNLVSFSTTVYIASLCPQASELVWAGLFSVIEGASRSHFVPPSVVDLMLELSDSIPLMEWDNRSIYRFRAVQYALQNLFEDFLDYCTHTCSYHSRPEYESMIPIVFTKSPESKLEIVKYRIQRHGVRIQEAVAGEMRLQAVEYASLVPPGITDMPQKQAQHRSRSDVRFPVHTIDKARTSAFVGRADVLDQLVAATNGSSKSHKKSAYGSTSHSPSVIAGAGYDTNISSTFRPLVCVLSGLGGVGKTQIALEYYYEHRDDYEACFWMEAEHDWTLAAQFAKISDKLELLPRKTTDNGGNEVQTKGIEAARTWLQTTERRWLVIFDNVESWADLDPYMPVECQCNGTVLITTQRVTIPSRIENVRTIPVEPLSLQDATKCIFKYLDREPKDEEECDVASQLAEHVGGLPLAMATIGGYVKQSQSSLAEFFESIKSKSTLWERAHMVEETPRHQRSLVTVFNKAFEDLDPAGRELLNILAFLDPDSIPEALFARGIEQKLFQHIKDEKDLPDCYFELRNRQLIRRDISGGESYLSIHRVVQMNVLLDLSKDYEERWRCFKQAFDMVQVVLPKANPMQTPEPGAWPLYSRYGRQILELRTHCLWPEPPVELPVSFARILADMGTYMWYSGKFPEGKIALGTAEQILDDNHAKEGDPLRTNIYSMLGIITSYEGVSNREKSMDFRRSAYHSRRQNIGKKPQKERTRDEDIMYWQMHSDMAYGYIQEEDFEATAKFMTECLEQYRGWERDEERIPFEYAKYYWLMAFCYMADQRPMDAVKSITRCHELMQIAAGSEHPMSQLVKFCHANILWHTEDPEMRQKALEINKAVLEFRRVILGEFSHFTLESYSTCGKLCCDAGETQRAREYLEICLERRKRAAWNEEGVSRALFRHTEVLRALAKEAQEGGEKEIAEALAEEADRKSNDIARVIERYRGMYSKYMPKTKDKEANLDQMVSFWSGRLTGGLRLDRPVVDMVDYAATRACRAEGERLNEMT